MESDCLQCPIRHQGIRRFLEKPRHSIGSEVVAMERLEGEVGVVRGVSRSCFRMRVG